MESLQDKKILRKMDDIMRKANEPKDAALELKDQRNRLSKLIPEYANEDTFNADKPHLVQRALDEGMTQEQIAKLSAKQVKGLLDRGLAAQRKDRLEKATERAKKASGNPEQQVNHLMRYLSGKGGA